MKNNKVRSVKRAPKAANKSKVYTSKKPSKKAKLTLKETVVPNDTYTNQNNSNTTYISVDADTLGKYPVVNTEPSITVYSDKDANGSVNLQDAYNKYSKVVEDENSEDNTKRSEMLPKNNDHTNMIVILIGIAAFSALLLLLI